MEKFKFAKGTREIFQGTNKNVYGTILGFGGISKSNWENAALYKRNAAIEMLSNEGKHITFAYLLFYNHTKCRIDRYLINSSEPYEVKLIEVNDSKYLDNRLTLHPKADMLENSYPIINNFHIKYIFNEDVTRSPKHIKSIYSFDGKLNKKFISYFLLEVCYSLIKSLGRGSEEIGFTSYSKIYDMSSIHSYENRLESLDLNKKSSSLRSKVFFPLDTNKTVSINMHSGLYNRLGTTEMFDEFESVTTLKINSINYQDGPTILKDLRRSIKQEPIHNNVDLDRFITRFNEISQGRLISTLK